MKNLNQITLSHNGKELPIKIKKLRNSKSIRMKPDFKTKGATITIPWHCSYKKAAEFASTNLNWLADLLTKHSSINILSLASLTLLGVNYSLHLVRKENNPIKIAIDANAIIITGNLQDSIKVVSKLSKFLKNLIKIYITAKVNETAKLLNTSFNQISLKDTKSKWGSCSSLKNLSFNWRLIFAPLEVIDYIVFHEVAHLIHFNHSKDFWNLVETICPNVKATKQWLKLNGSMLNSYIIG